uniref:Uncharacterized protein n=1 Tax=Oryza brachyantha TaxID=4533 RepID=J3LIW6_ORYBR
MQTMDNTSSLLLNSSSDWRNVAWNWKYDEVTHTNIFLTKENSTRIEWSPQAHHQNKIITSTKSDGYKQLCNYTFFFSFPSASYIKHL